jgi:lipoyl(octanoyl) transferase
MAPRSAWLLQPDGPVPYDAANEAMHHLAARRLAGEIPDTVILLEHPPVFTAGRRARADELRWPVDEVEARGGLVRRIDRGGSFTFHGPGQLVGYPILDLGARPDAGGYLRGLEEALILACADLGLDAGRVEGRSGVWVSDDRGERKVAAIGIRVSQGVTMHGFALNCDCDLTWFDRIVPCGITDAGVTSLTRELGRPVGVADVIDLVEGRLPRLLAS